MVVFQFLIVYAWALGVIVIVVYQRRARRFNSFAWKDMGDERGHLVFLCLLRLGGLPPFVGFYAKLLIINALVLQHDLAVARLLVVTAG